jgi:hypothetical protein
VIFDEYTARMRALPRPESSCEDELLRAHDETTAIVTAAVSEVERLTAIADQKPAALRRVPETFA